ncbi:Kinesin-like protein KIF28P [Folsomia candida]|uniref:Kinesin-like protein KIF28P n=2 Tax=Folsomia candida TaxID=158441 RepID=A0A226E0T4_FOLCA|nr:Kinesin-like protein KIF28P [Folsomia candida]
MLEFDGHPVSVAVRIRPPPQIQSKKVTNSFIQVEDPTTISITNPDDSSEIRVFGFTHCYWSFDGYAELQDGHFIPDLKHENGSRYADQIKIFDHFGKEMVQNAWLGYNSSFLSIGESGSGKSWTLFGTGTNKGIIPLFGAELFKTIKDKEKGSSSPIGHISSEVKLSMMEIRENKVRDLLAGGNNTKYKSVVKIREHPKRGFYVEGLRSVIVSSADEIQLRLDEGHLARAVSSTSFNLNCTRSKTTVIVEMSIVQKYRNAKGDEVAMSALVGFYDLPVSGVRNCDNGPTVKFSTNKSSSNHGQRMTNPAMTQGPSSNTTTTIPPPLKSFDDHFTKLVSALGNNSSISYTNSTVTKLLERALSGNSKTYVLSHCIPTENSYETSLSSLILADKLQRLTTHPLINEEMTNKLIRELKLENDNLKKMLTNGDLEKNEFFSWHDKLNWLKTQDSEEFRRQLIDDVKSQTKDNEREIKILHQSLEERLKLAKLDKPSDNSQNIKKLETEKKHKSFIFNLNPDCQLSSRIFHFISAGSTDFGSAKGKDGTIHVQGPGIRETHGTFTYTAKENKMTIKPTGPDCLIKVNGKQILYESPLFHNDRIVFGGCQIWLFQNPREPWAEKGLSSPLSSKITYQFAEEEITSKSSFFNYLSHQNGSVLVSPKLKASIRTVLPLVDDANAMCDDLERGVRFDPIVLHDIRQVLLSSGAQDLDRLSNSDKNCGEQREFAVQLSLYKEDISFVLSTNEFLEKYEKIKDSFIQNQEDGIVSAAIGSVNSPSSSFAHNDTTLLDLVNTEVTIGHGLLSLKPLAYLIQFQDEIEILDYLTLKTIGSIKVEVVPCNEYFEELKNVHSFLIDSSDLLAKPLHFILKIGTAESLSSKFRDITSKYKVHTEPVTSTGKLDLKPSYSSSNSQYIYERRFSIEHVTPKLIESLERDLVIFTFYGRQRPKKMRNQFKSEYNDRNYTNSQSHPEPVTIATNPYLGLVQKQRAELVVFGSRGARIQQKLGMLQSMLELSDNLSQDAIPVDYIKKICNAKDKDVASECVSAFKEEFTPPPEIEPVKKLTTYQKISEVCAIV